MKIIEIRSANLQEYIGDIIALSDEFLELLDIGRDRTSSEKTAIINGMIESPPTRLLVVLDDEESAVGISYYNYGHGYACGGSYLWLNCIYIRSHCQNRGYGTRLLDHIRADGEKHGIHLFLCCRDNDNEASRRLFTKSSFTQESLTMMSIP